MAKVLHPRSFPFCPQIGTISGGSYIKTDLAGAMRIYWKIKTTTFVGTEYGSYGPITKTFTFFRSFNQSTQIENETYLVCNPGYNSPESQAYNSAIFLVYWDQMKVNKNDFYIPLYFNFDAGDNEGKFGSSGIYQNTTSINIYGFNVEASSEGWPNVDPVNFLSLSQPSVTYWPYAN